MDQALLGFKSEPWHITISQSQSPKSTYWQTQTQLQYISTVWDAFEQTAKADYSLCKRTNPRVVTLSKLANTQEMA